MVNHGITTGALFLCVGIIYERTHTRELATATGIGQVMPVYVTALTVFGLSSLAFPGTNSFVGEFLILAGGFTVSPEADGPDDTGGRSGCRLYAADAPADDLGGTENPDSSQLLDLNIREMATLAFLVVFVIWIGIVACALYRCSARQR